MKPKEIIIADEANTPHQVLKCLSCSIAGLDLLTLFPEGEPDTDNFYTEAQLD